MFECRQPAAPHVLNGLRNASPIVQPLPLTHHAEIRLQQRGIPHQVLDILMKWGRRCHVVGGGNLVFFSKHDMTRLKRSLPKATWLEVESRRRVYAVLSQDGAVVTAGHRYRHLVRQ